MMMSLPGQNHRNLLKESFRDGKALLRDHFMAYRHCPLSSLSGNCPWLLFLLECVMASSGAEYFWTDLKGKKKISFFDREFWVDEEFSWIAVCSDGKVRVFKRKPTPVGFGGANFWVVGNPPRKRNYETIGYLKEGVFGDWRQSLKAI